MSHVFGPQNTHSGLAQVVLAHLVFLDSARVFFTATNALDGATLQLRKCLCASKTESTVYLYLVFTVSLCLRSTTYKMYIYIYTPLYTVKWSKIVAQNFDRRMIQNMLGLAVINNPPGYFLVLPPPPKRMKNTNHQCRNVEQFLPQIN